MTASTNGNDVHVECCKLHEDEVLLDGKCSICEGLGSVCIK